MDCFSGWLMAGGLGAASCRSLNYAAGGFIGKGARAGSGDELLMSHENFYLPGVEKHRKRPANPSIN